MIVFQVSDNQISNYGIIPSDTVNIYYVLKIPAHEDISAVDRGQGYVNTIIEACLSNHILLYVPICKVNGIIRYNKFF